MWKKYDKLDLKSQNYKVKKTPDKQTPYNSKSPKHNTNTLEQNSPAQKVHPEYLFQKVCCPNCRYLFKIIKNAELLKSTTAQKGINISIAIQTQPLVLNTPKYVNTLPESTNKPITLKSEQSPIFKTGSIKHNISRSPKDKDSDHLKPSTYQFLDKINKSQNRSIKKLNQSHLLNVNQSRDHSSRKSSILFDKKQPTYMNDYPAEHDKNIVQNIVRQQLRKDLAQLPHLLSLELNTTKAVDHLTSFYSELPESVEVPSYFKMLVNDYSSTIMKLQSQNISNP